MLAGLFLAFSNTLLCAFLDKAVLLYCIVLYCIVLHYVQSKAGPKTPRAKHAYR